MKMNKKGFTIVELVIVIVVIAILAAVLIPTFASLTKKANQSADIQAARQMNVALQAGSVEGKPDFQGAIEILDEAGFEVASLEPVTKGHTFYWCSDHNVILLVEDETNEVLHPTDKGITQLYTAHKTANFLTDLAEGKTYINVEATTSEAAKEALANGSDLSLKEDVAVDGMYTVPEGKEQTIDLNGNDFDASAVQNRPFWMSEGSTLTINAEGSTIKTGLYGLVNIPSGVSGTIVVNGGTFTSDMDNGAFLKLRAGGGDVNIVLNNVTFTDASDDSYVINTQGFTGNLNLTVNGGSYTSQLGFEFRGNATFENVTINSQAGGIVVYGADKVVTVKNCNITSGSAMQYAPQGTPAAAVMVQNGAKATVTDCTLKADVYTYAIVNSGGTIEATNTTTSGAGTYRVWDQNADTTGTLKIDGAVVVTKTGK